MPAKQTGVPADLVSNTIRFANPWIEFFNSATHGYGVLTLTPEQLPCEFKAVSTITQPTATQSTLATFAVPVNEVKLRRL